jgi:uncharacterized protein
MELEVADHPEQERFEIHADGELAGFVDYRLHDGELALLHAETLSRFRHRGFAGRLVQFSLDSARERQLAVLPYCPFVRRWIADHAEYAGLVPEDRRPHFGLLSIGAPMSFTARARFTGSNRYPADANAGG